MEKLQTLSEKTGAPIAELVRRAIDAYQCMVGQAWRAPRQAPSRHSHISRASVWAADHYLNYSAVLVRLSRVTPDVLRDLLGMAHKFVTMHEARRPTSRHRRKPA